MSANTISLTIDSQEMGLTGNGTFDLTNVFKTLFTENQTFNEEMSNKISEVIKGIKQNDIVADWTNKLKDAFVIDKANINLKKIVEDKVKDILKTNKTDDIKNVDKREQKSKIVSKTIINSFKNFDVKITDFLKKIEKSNKQSDNTNIKDTVFKEKNEIVVSGFTDEALKKLEKITGKKTRDLEQKKDEKPIDEGFLSKMLKGLALGAVGLLGGSIALAISSLFDDGPFKGAKKLISDIGLRVSSNLFKVVGKLVELKFGFIGEAVEKTVGLFSENVGKIMTKIFPNAIETITKISGIGKGAGALIKNIGTKFGTFIIKFGKKLPILGGLFSFASAVTRLNSDDPLGAVADVVIGILNIAGGATFGVTSGIALGLEALMALRDYKYTPAEKKKQNINFTNMMSGFLKYAKKIPIVAKIIEFTEGLEFLTRPGQFTKGLKKLGSILGFGSFDDLSEINESQPTDKKGNPVDYKALKAAREETEKNAKKQVESATPTAPAPVKEVVKKQTKQSVLPSNKFADVDSGETHDNEILEKIKQEQKLLKKQTNVLEPSKSVFYNETSKTNKQEQKLLKKQTNVLEPSKSVFYNETSKTNKQTKQLNDQVKTATNINPTIAPVIEENFNKTTKKQKIQKQETLKKEAKKLGIEDENISGVYKDDKLISIISNNKTYNIQPNVNDSVMDTPTIKVEDATIDFGKFKIKPDKQDKLSITETGGILAKSGGVLESQFKDLIKEVQDMKKTLTNSILNMNDNINKNLQIINDTSTKQLQTLPLLAPKPDVKVNQVPNANTTRDGIFDYRTKVAGYGRL